MQEESSASIRTVTPPTAKVSRPSVRRLVGAAVGIVVAASLFLLPAMQHIRSSTRAVMGVLALAILFWMFSVLENHIVGLLMLALLLLVRVSPDVVFGGFATSSFWLLLGALYFGFVMKKTRLADRIALVFLRLFKPSYLSILWALFLIGLVLSLAIPAFTVRIAIMVTLAWSIVRKMGLPERSRASALITVSAFEMAVLPGFAVLTGSITSLQFAALYHELGLHISWLEYARIATVPALLCSLLMLAGNLLALRPEALLSGRFFIESELAELGAVSRDEKWTLLIITASVGLWATQRFHGIDESGVALFALVALFLTKVMVSGDFTRGISWELLIFMGAIFTMLKVFAAYGIDKLFSTAIVAKLTSYHVSAVSLLMLVPLLVFFLKLFMPTGFLPVMLVFLALYRPLMEMGIQPTLVAIAAMLALVPFWFLYQNYWFAMVDEISEHKAFTRGQQVRMATIYAVAVVLSVVIGTAYWRGIGLIPR